MNILIVQAAQEFNPSYCIAISTYCLAMNIAVLFISIKLC